MSLQKVTYGFIPTSITGCALWLDGADSSTITGTSPVTQWRDKSVNNYSMTYTGSPTYRTTAALNNLGCITFNGTTSFNSGTDTMYWSGFSISQPFTVFVVCTKRLSSNANFSFVLEPSTSSGSVILYGGLQLKMYAGSADQYTNPILTFVANSTYVYSAVFNGASSLLAYAGNATSSLNPGTASWPGLYLGRDWGGTYDSGDYGEIIFYSGALSTTERQQVEGYLAQKWGLTSSLPASHPSRSTTLYRSDYTKQNVMRAIPYYTQFSPRQIAGCALWLDGADPAGTGVLPANNSTLATWVDKSGLGNNATQSTSGSRPSFKQGYQNGIGSVYFTPANNMLLPSLTIGPLTIFVVAKLVTFANNNFFLSLGTYANAIYIRSVYSPPYFGVDGGIGPLTTTNADTNYHIFSYTQGSTGSFWFDGSAISVGSAIPTNTGSFTYTSQNTIGGWNGYTNSVDSVISEILIFNTPILSTTQRQQVESYLAQKWGLTASLPGGHSHLTQPAGAVTRTALANLRLVVQPRRYVSFRWTITAGNTTSLIQFSEFQVGFNGTQLVFASPTTATTGSSISWNTGAGEGPAQAVDNNLNTKGLGIGTSGLVLIVTVATPIAANMYRWATANDVTPGRNPTQWTVDGSADGTTFVRLHTQNTTYSTPSSTFTYTSWINFTYS